jgi:hypothetical protein
MGVSADHFIADRKQRTAQPLLDPSPEDNMAEEKKITETTTKTKDDLFGDPKEQKTTTTERETKSDALETEEQTETTIEGKEEE